MSSVKVASQASTKVKSLSVTVGSTSVSQVSDGRVGRSKFKASPSSIARFHLKNNDNRKDGLKALFKITSVLNM